MKKFIATIHHLGFYWPSEQPEGYGESILSLEIEDSDLRSGEVIAELFFDVTNNPSKTPNFTSKQGRCPTLSVGDVVEIHETGKEIKKEYWLCVGAGWFQIQKSEISYLASKIEQFAESGKRFDPGYNGTKFILARRERQAKYLATLG